MTRTDPHEPPQPAPVEEAYDDELVAEDDRVIGHAFRWSVIVLVVLAAGAGSVWWLNRSESIKKTIVQDPTPPQPIPTVASIPALPFHDITQSAGIDFVHVNGARGEKLLPETMGGGCAFLDYDGDGDQDILLINSTNWPDAPAEVLAKPQPTQALYRNDGKGKFTNVTSGSGLTASFYGMGCAVGDFDNDGDPDIFITAVGLNHLYRNDGGTFKDVTVAAHVGGDDKQWSTGCAFVDYDNDGKLDLFVCNYVRWSKAIDFAVNYQLTGIGRAYGPPTNFEGTNPYLYHNNGDGTFTDVSATAGVQIKNVATGVPVAKSLAVAPIDIDGDGWIDLMVANDTVQKFFFHNTGNGTFVEEGAKAGLAFDRNGNSTGAMGIDSAFYRNDSTLGIVVANFANEMSSLYVSQGKATQFADEAITEGLGSPTRTRLKFGAFFFDSDLDGRLDLLHANGHIEDQINVVQASQQYKQPGQLFWNAGPQAASCFVEVPAKQIGDLAKPIVGRGAAYADIDGDGDLDVLITQIAGPPLLLRNDQNFAHHWLRVKLVGKTANRDAIGAWIELTSGGVTQRRQVMPTRSYLSQVELPVTFGLGGADAVQSMRITWPGGKTQDVPVKTLNTTMTVEQQ